MVDTTNNDKLIEFLHSIAIMAVKAQQNINNAEFVSDALSDIQSDTEEAFTINNDRLWIAENRNE